MPACPASVDRALPSGAPSCTRLSTFHIHWLVHESKADQEVGAPECRVQSWPQRLLFAIHGRGGRRPSRNAQDFREGHVSAWNPACDPRRSESPPGRRRRHAPCLRAGAVYARNPICLSSSRRRQRKLRGDITCRGGDDVQKCSGEVQRPLENFVEVRHGVFVGDRIAQVANGREVFRVVNDG